ncbi:MAG: DUF488 domain-containing protein [Syntrophomonadaceae bacterium]|nr:DUF488 domain-containing protein [Syntrophomonadaceae bacterium]
MDDKTVYTIGHSNILLGKFIDLLEKFEINIVIDVRSTPYSRYASQFNRENLKISLRDQGIEYNYAGDLLGGRPEDPDCYKNNSVPQGSADYLNLVDYAAVMAKEFFLEGIQLVYELRAKERVALMCSEEDPAKCHRHHLIGRYLVDQGVNVIHIRGDGNTAKDQTLPNVSDDPQAEQLGLFQ